MSKRSSRKPENHKKIVAATYQQAHQNIYSKILLRHILYLLVPYLEQSMMTRVICFIQKHIYIFSFLLVHTGAALTVVRIQTCGHTVASTPSSSKKEL